MERLKYIDAAKGVAIVSIVLLHFENGIFSHQLNLFISAYMITMFYVTAGWIDAMQRTCRSLKEYAKHRWSQLMVPYLWWTLIILAFDAILWLCHYYDGYFMARELYKSITLRGIGTLWFLPALFGGSILWQCTKMLNKWYVYLLVLLIALDYQSFYQSTFAIRTDSIGRLIDSPFRAINAMFGAWIGIAAGYMFQRHIMKYEKLFNKVVTFIVGIAFCAISFWIETRLHFSGAFWTLSVPLLSPLGLILIFRAIEKIPYCRKILLPLIYCGRHSMAIMVTHYSIILVICIIINWMITGDNELVGFYSLIWFAFAMAIEYYLIIKLELISPYLFGRKS